MLDFQNTLHQITHMYFDLTTPEGLKIKIRQKKRKLREEQEREDT